MKKIFIILAVMLPVLFWSNTSMASYQGERPDSVDCQALFTMNGNQNNPFTVEFMDFSLPFGAITSWNWTFGDGLSSTEQNPSHTYTSPGNYVITLEIASPFCSSTMSMDFLLLDSTGCNCVMDYDPVCVIYPNGDIVEFTNECWAFCNGFTPNNFVDCDIDPLDCQSNFYSTPNPNNNYEITFMAYEVIPATVVAWQWEFGDGTSSADSMPTHVYADDSTYTVTLTTTTADGCTSTYTDNVYIYDNNPCNCPNEYAPVCVATPNGGTYEYTNECYAICDGFTPNNFVQCDSIFYDLCDAMFCYESDFNNAMQVEFHDFSFGFGEIVAWAWDFGDGNTSTEQNPTHTYSDYGVFNATLTITTESGCTSTIVMEVWLEDYTPCNCSPVYNPVCVEGPNGTMTFYNECEAICYGYDTFVACDSVPNNECEAFFGYYQDFFNNDLTINFEDYSYATAPITSWLWTFGDGTSSTEQFPTHTYVTDGEYIVALTITSDSCTSTMEEVVFVGDFTFTDCQAFFWPFPDSSGTDLTYEFYNLSLGSSDTWSWDFGDGNTSTEQNPTHTYAASGTYTVSLMISGANCQSSFELVLDTDDFFIDPNTSSSNDLQALYTPVIDLENNAVYFKNQSTSTSDITEINYEFGDGQTASAANVQHTFPSKKPYSVTMLVTNSAGLVSSFTGTIDLTTGLFKSATSSSSIVLGNRNIEQADFDLAITPNPAVSDVTVSFSTSVAGKYSIDLTTLTGQSLYSTSFNGQKGAHQVDLDVQDFPQGIYFLKLQVNDAYQTYKLVKGYE